MIPRFDVPCVWEEVSVEEGGPGADGGWVWMVSVGVVAVFSVVVRVQVRRGAGGGGGTGVGGNGVAHGPGVFVFGAFVGLLAVVGVVVFGSGGEIVHRGGDFASLDAFGNMHVSHSLKWNKGNTRQRRDR